MKATERIDNLISMIPYNGVILVKDLATKFDVTEETIRRDLSRIMDMNIGICKVHGGAYRVSKGDETSPFSFRATMMVDEKQRLADYCVTLIKPESCVMLDASTTSLFIAKKIRDQKLRVTVVTNSIPIVMEFENEENIKAILLGGQLRKRNESLVGNQTLDLLSRYCGDYCFISPTSINEKYGMTDHSEMEAAVRRRMLDQSAKHYLVSDHSKFGWISMHKIADFSAIHTLITDEEPSDKWCSIFQKNNITWQCC